jgi:hypothetical protein
MCPNSSSRRTTQFSRYNEQIRTQLKSWTAQASFLPLFKVSEDVGVILELK